MSQAKRHNQQGWRSTACCANSMPRGSVAILKQSVAFSPMMPNSRSLGPSHATSSFLSPLLASTSFVRCLPS